MSLFSIATSIFILRLTFKYTRQIKEEQFLDNNKISEKLSIFIEQLFLINLYLEEMQKAQNKEDHDERLVNADIITRFSEYTMKTVLERRFKFDKHYFRLKQQEALDQKQEFLKNPNIDNNNLKKYFKE